MVTLLLLTCLLLLLLVVQHKKQKRSFPPGFSWWQLMSKTGKRWSVCTKLASSKMLSRLDIVWNPKLRLKVLRSNNFHQLKPGPPSLPIIGSFPFIRHGFTKHGFADFATDSSVRLYQISDGNSLACTKTHPNFKNTYSSSSPSPKFQG